MQKFNRQSLSKHLQETDYMTVCQICILIVWALVLTLTKVGFSPSLIFSSFQQIQVDRLIYNDIISLCFPCSFVASPSYISGDKNRHLRTNDLCKPKGQIWHQNAIKEEDHGGRTGIIVLWSWIALPQVDELLVCKDLSKGLVLPVLPCNEDQGVGEKF